MTRLGVVLLLLLALAGCSGGLTEDQEVDDLGAHIVATVERLSQVEDASYRYVHGLDIGQNLRVRIILREADATPPAVQEAIDTAAEEFWLSPAQVFHIQITAYSSANPPAGDDDAEQANKDRAIGSRNIDDAPSFDRPEMEQKYGPRPTKPR